MKITDEHKYHGAALNQIAEDPHFTAINAFWVNGEISRSAFVINHNIGVYLKYSSKPVGLFREYRFTFRLENMAELELLKKSYEKVYLALVCVQDGHICCLAYSDLMQMIDARREYAGYDEDQYQILVTLPEGKSFRAYVNTPGVRGKMLAMQIISRNSFPSRLFAD